MSVCAIERVRAIVLHEGVNDSLCLLVPFIVAEGLRQRGQDFDDVPPVDVSSRAAGSREVVPIKMFD